jgi:hypothetical protein
MDLNGENAMILYRRHCGSPMICIIMILRWQKNLAGIRFLQANVPNAAPLFRGCGFPLTDGAVNAVAGKMIFKSLICTKSHDRILSAKAKAEI